ncbi:MAG: hypothetical protein ACR2GQ_02810 [Gemmatimonadota bacterium]
MRQGSRTRRTARLLGVLLGLGVAPMSFGFAPLGFAPLGFGAAPLAAQDAAPRLPFGSRAVVMPLQSARPTPGGAWPGRTSSQEEAVRAMDAEFAFALGSRRSAENWALPDAVRRRVERNPLIEVNPDRLAFQGLLARPDKRDQIYEPLHGQLRTLAALFGTRYVVLPLLLRVLAVEGADPEMQCGDAAPEQAELLFALIDIRRSAVLWHGTVKSGASCPDSGALLAMLASAVTYEITDS